MTIRFEEFAYLALTASVVMLVVSCALGVYEIHRARRVKQAQARFAESTELSTALLADIAARFASQSVRTSTYGDKRFRTGAIPLPPLPPEEIEWPSPVDLVKRETPT